jgi:hypothetical protein
MSITYTNYSHPANQVKNMFDLQIAEKPTTETPIAFHQHPIRKLPIFSTPLTIHTLLSS